MVIIPAVDIKDNQCVRLRQGKAEDMEVFSPDPCAMSVYWEKQGAEILHIVDLDGAFQGKPIHQAIIKKIVQKVGIPVQVGGGIRNRADIEEYLDSGVYRVVLGTFLLSQEHERVKDIIRQFGHYLVAGMDVKDHYPAIQGWVQAVEQPVEPLIAYLTGLGIQRIIYTDIYRDGMLTGPNIEMIQKILQRKDVKLIASGGISSMNDLYRLQPLTDSGLEGVIIGKALYRGHIKLRQAMKVFHSEKGNESNGSG